MCPPEIVPMPRHFDPVSLRHFIAVCEEGNIALAADREAIVPSAISKRIAALEDDIGTKLLIRGRRGIEPTGAGEALLRQAREILSMMERTHLALSEFKGGIHGSVRVLASLSVLAEQLPDDIAHFLATYRSVQVSLEEKLSVEIVRGVREARADFGVCWNAGDMGGLETVNYRTDQLCVVAHPDHPLATCEQLDFKETLEHELINVEPGSIMQVMLSRYAAIEGKSLRFRVEVSNFDAASRIVAARLGIAILPREVAAPLAHALGLRLVPLADPWARRQFVIVTRPDGPMSKTARLLVSYLQERAQQSVAPPAAQ
jgi:DNA-binding transcriptional LysR family regulator